MRRLAHRRRPHRRRARSRALRGPGPARRRPPPPRRPPARRRRRAHRPVPRRQCRPAPVWLMPILTAMSMW
ncbi:MAG: hypothetical protein EXR62_08525 [Chloroflexi bacterium]|nr:hypothetical protein [Chloroflexota bacterium]